MAVDQSLSALVLGMMFALQAHASLGRAATPLQPVPGSYLLSLDMRLDQERDLTIDDKPLSYWLDRLKDSNYSERKRAAQALIRIGPQAKDAVPDLIRMLRSEKDGVMQGLAAYALGAIGPAADDAVPTLADALGRATGGHMSPGHATARALVQIRERGALPILLPLLKHDREYVRRCAADAIVLAAPDDGPTLDAIVALLNNPDKGIHDTAVRVTRQLKPISKLAVPALIEGLRDESAYVRYDAATDLAAIGPDAEAAVPTLTELLRDEYVKVVAANAIWRIAADSEKVLPVLVEALNSQDKEQRRHAIYCLGLLGPRAKNALAALIDAVKDRDPVVRSRALEAIGKIGPEAEIAMADLEQVLSDGDAHSRILAAGAIWQISAKRESVFRVLVHSLRNGEPDSWLAAQYLGDMGPEARDAVPVLEDALRGNLIPSAYRDLVRVHAASALWRINGETTWALAVLIEYLDDPTREATYRAAVEALTEIGAQAKTALPHLQRGLQYPDSRTRELVAKAIKSINSEVR